MNQHGTLIKVGIFTAAMLLVAAMLVVVFGEFRFASERTPITPPSRKRRG